MNRWQQIRNILKIFPSGRELLLAMLVVVGLVGCDSPADGQAGVISTGNTARVIGKVAARSGGLVRTIKLVTRQGRDVRVVDSTRSDSAGRFQFTETSSGTYWVEAWQGSHLIGASSEFVSDGKDVEIMVAIIDPIYLRLDLRELGRVDSVFVDFPDNPGRNDDSLWSVSLLRDSGSILHARIDQGGAPKWTEWLIQVKNGKASFVGLADAKSIPFLRQLDTSVFSVDRHTVALWSFDSMRADGRIPDLGPGAFDLDCPRAAILDPSPHGKSLRVRSLVGLAAAMTNGKTIPPALRWTRTGQWTMQIRLRLDSFPEDGFQVAGLIGEPILSISQGRALVINQRIISSRSGDTLSNLFITKSGIVPVGRWIDVSVSVDAVRDEIYVWMDGQAQDLVALVTDANGRLLRDTAGSFFVGGLPSDYRRGPVEIDEIRLSDTLVHGRGFPRQTSLSWVLGIQSEVVAVAVQDSAGMVAVRPGAAKPMVGLGVDGRKLGRYLWNPAIPVALEGREIVFAMAYFFDAKPKVPSSRTFALHEILEPWGAGDSKLLDWIRDDVFDGVRVGATPRSFAPLLESAETGGILFDVTMLVQKWIADPATRHGVLLRAGDEDRPLGRQILGSAHPGMNYPIKGGYEPALIVYYR